MGFATVYCESCGSQILGAEFEKGRAVHRAGKNYCPECAPKLPPEAPGSGGDRKGSQRVKRPGETRNTDIIRNLQSMGSPGNTTRVSHAHPAPSQGLSGPAKIGALAASLVVLAGIGFIMTRGGPPAPDTSKGKDAWDRVEAMRATAAPRELLEAARRAQREASGTQYEGRIADVVREATEQVEKLERVAKLEREMTNLLEEARIAEDPSLSVPMLRDLALRSKTDAPELEQKINAGIDSILQRSVLKIIGAIDFSLAGTIHGYKRVTDQLDDAERRAKNAGAAAKGLLDTVAAKRKEASDAFEKASGEQFADLEKRVKVMLEGLNFDQATSAVTGFLNDYRGMAIEPKATALLESIAAAKKALDNAWVDANAEADWKLQLGDAKATFAGGVITLTCDGTATDGDLTRRIIFKKSDETWKEVEIEFEVFLEKNGGAVLLCQAAESPVSGGLKARVGNDGLDTGRWWKCYVRVIGGQVFMGLSGQQAPGRPATVGAGGVAFAVYPGSKLQLRNIRVRKLR